MNNNANAGSSRASNGYLVGMEYPSPQSQSQAQSPNAKGKARDGGAGGSEYYNSQIAAASAAGGVAGGPGEFVPSPTEGMVGVGVRSSLIRNSQILTNGLVAAPQQLSASPSALAPTPAVLAGPAGPPPHLVAQPEICVECMMRDRDMADVDVTGEGIWERESDKEWEEAMAVEEAGGVWGGNVAGGAGSSSEGSMSREHGSATGSWNGLGVAQGPSAGGRRRIGKGNKLTTEALKAWTAMNPPASAFRWRTLQGYLATQIHLLELERAAREATALEKERETRERGLRTSTLSNHSSVSLLAAAGRNRSSTLLPNGLVVEKVDVERDERLAKERARARGMVRTRSRDERRGVSGGEEDEEEVRVYETGDQPWLSSQTRRFSSPGLRDSRRSASPSIASAFGSKFARSSTDLRSIASPRSISPGRTSLGVEDRRASSMWSRFRKSGSGSVYSYAPSGSMMDMHLGLSQDKHDLMAGTLPRAYETYPSRYELDRASAYVVGGGRDGAKRDGDDGEQDGESGKKKKKKGIKGFFSKLVSGGANGEEKKRRARAFSASEPTTPRGPLYTNYDDRDDFYDDLEPPPPLSALANEPRYHQRSASNSSVDSLPQPFTPPPQHYSPGPPVGHPPRALSNPGTSTDPYWTRGGIGAGGPADRGSVLTTGSFNSLRSTLQSKPVSPAPARLSGSNPYNQRPSMDYLSPEPSPPKPAGYLRATSPDRESGRREPLIGEQEGEEEVLHAVVRKEKSLPSLPSEANHASPTSPTGGYPFPETLASHHPQPNSQFSRSAYSIRTPSLSPSLSRGAGGGEWDGEDSVGGGRKSKAKSKVFSLGFPGFGGAKNKKRKGSDERDMRERERERSGDTVVSERAMERIAREGGELVSVRF
ncbi:hypothetical protein MNV49_005375 [Pseudohyphozyma bogoriensis]|nr:hypothetical protein MNV49_005375 [Pseudohyphozyma bogoriensis]